MWSAIFLYVRALETTMLCITKIIDLLTIKSYLFLLFHIIVSCLFDVSVELSPMRKKTLLSWKKKANREKVFVV